MIPYSTTKLFSEISHKTGLPRSILMEYMVQKLAKEKLNKEVPTVNFDRVVNDLHIQDKIREQTDVLRVATLFGNTVERVNVLKNKLTSYEEIVNFVKNEIFIVDKYIVSNRLKRQSIKQFKEFLKGLRNNKKDYKNHIELIHTQMNNYNTNVIHLNYNTKDDMVQKAIKHSTQRIKANELHDIEKKRL